MYAVAPGNRDFQLDAIIKCLVETCDGCINPVEGLTDLTVVIADVDDRSDDCSPTTRTESSADIISGQ